MVNQVQCSITMMPNCYSSPCIVSLVFQLASARKLFEAGLYGWLSAVSGVRLWSETEITTSSSIYSFIYYRYFCLDTYSA